MTRKQGIVLGIKVAIGAGLIFWLIRSGTLDFGSLSLFLERPSLLVANVGVFALSVILASLRWRLLLRLADIHISVGRAMQLTMTALFFNVALPGNIGGDVLKAIYVARGAGPGKLPGAFAIAFLDRVIALAGLIAVAFVLTMARGRVVWEDPQLRDLTLAVIVLAIGTFIAPVLLLLLVRRSGKRFDAWTESPSRIARILGKLVAALKLIAGAPKTLLAAIGLAIVIHLGGITLFSALTNAIMAQDVSISTMADIYPLGMLSMVLPISYAGFGVGHVAFDQLFAMAGLVHGATVLNVYLIGQTVPCLFGVIPYLTLRREAVPPTEAELAAAPKPE